MLVQTEIPATDDRTEPAIADRESPRASVNRPQRMRANHPTAHARLAGSRSLVGCRRTDRTRQRYRFPASLVHSSLVCDAPTEATMTIGVEILIWLILTVLLSNCSFRLMDAPRASSCPGRSLHRSEPTTGDIRRELPLGRRTKCRRRRGQSPNTPDLNSGGRQVRPSRRSVQRTHNRRAQRLLSHLGVKL